MSRSGEHKGGRPAVGIDLGGTKVRAGVVDPAGDILGEMKVPTRADTDAETVLGNIADAARGAMSEAGVRAGDVRGVGLGSPGPLDIREGVLISPVNLPALHDFPLRDRLSEVLDQQVSINNDANCFGLAEARFGAGADAEVCCGLTLGTGLGCFVVIGGRLFDGPHGAGAEIWCSPYRGDRVEEKVSGRGIARNYEKLSGRRASAEQVASRAEEGEEEAREAYREFGRDLAVPVAYLCNVADPDVLVLGGSITKAWKLFGEVMVDEALKYINAVNREVVHLTPGALGDEAAVLGAASLVLVSQEPENTKEAP